MSCFWHLPLATRFLFASLLVLTILPPGCFCLGSGAGIRHPLRFHSAFPLACIIRPPGCFFLLLVARRSRRISLYFVIPYNLALAVAIRFAFSARCPRHFLSGRQAASSCILSPLARGAFFFYFVIPYVLALAFVIRYAFAPRRPRHILSGRQAASFFYWSLPARGACLCILPSLTFWLWPSSSATFFRCVASGIYYPAARLPSPANCRLLLAAHLFVSCHPLCLGSGIRHPLRFLLGFSPGISYLAAGLLLFATFRPLLAANMFVFCHPLCLSSGSRYPLRLVPASPPAFTIRPPGCFFVVTVASCSRHSFLYFVIAYALALAFGIRHVYAPGRARHLLSRRRAASSCYSSPLVCGASRCILSPLTFWL